MRSSEDCGFFRRDGKLQIFGVSKIAIYCSPSFHAAPLALRRPSHHIGTVAGQPRVAAAAVPAWSRAAGQRHRRVGAALADARARHRHGRLLPGGGRDGAAGGLRDGAARARLRQARRLRRQRAPDERRPGGRAPRGVARHRRLGRAHDHLRGRHPAARGGRRRGRRRARDGGALRRVGLHVENQGPFGRPTGAPSG